MDEYRDRLNYEISVIRKTGFAGYFLIVADFINYAKPMTYPWGPAEDRRQAVSFAYSLGITDIDPIKYDLTFERFPQS